MTLGLTYANTGGEYLERDGMPKIPLVTSSADPTSGDDRDDPHRAKMAGVVTLPSAARQKVDA
jgi:hypothetical protein